MSQAKTPPQIEHNGLKYSEKLLINRFPKLDWKVLHLDFPNNKELS